MTNWYDNVPAPTDASGRVVPLDTMELVYKGETREVWSIIYNIERGCWSVSFGWFDSVDISACTLPDSWNRLEKDARKTPREYIEGRGITAEPGGRVATMTSDILRRAKALAVVTKND